MWRCLLLSAMIAASAARAMAASRYYCAADDANIKLSLDVGFETNGARKLNHFRGALIAKAASVPAGARTLMLDSRQLVHHWSYAGDLRLEIFASGGNEDAGQTIDLIVTSSGPTGSAAMPGTYILTFATRDRTPLELKGRLSCSVK